MAVAVRLDGRVVLHHRGRSLSRVEVRHEPTRGRHPLRITTRYSDGSQRTSVRRLRGCGSSGRRSA